MSKRVALVIGVLPVMAGCGPPGSEPLAVTASVETLRTGQDFDLVSGDISPDGRFLTQVNWASGDLQLLDLTTGDARDLTGQGYAGGYAWTSAFSPDGQRIAYAWYLDSLHSHELRVVDLPSGQSRVVVAARRDRYYIDPVDWSDSGGDILVAIQEADRTWQLASVEAATGAVRVLRVLDWQAPGGGHDQAYPDADLSPDGRYLAWDYPPEPEAATRDVFVASVDGGPSTAIVTGPRSDRLLGWLPDGSGILFYSDRNGTPSIWRQPLRDGRAAGTATLVRRDVEALVPLGFTRRGYAFGVILEAERVHLATLPADGPVSSDAARPVHGPAWRRSLAFDFSPDGSRTALAVQDPFPDPSEALVLATLDGGVERTIPLSPALHASNGTLRWVDPSRLYLFAYQRGIDGVFEITLPEGTHRRVTLPVDIGRGAFKWFDAALGSRILYMVSEGDLVAVDAVSGASRRLGETQALRASVAVSPDGRELAYLTRDRAAARFELRVRSVDGATGRTVYRAPAGRMGPPVSWTADGSRLLFGLETANGPRGLWTVPARGGAPTRLLDGCCQENHARLDAHGRLLFVGGAHRTEIRLLRGY